MPRENRPENDRPVPDDGAEQSSKSGRTSRHHERPPEFGGRREGLEPTRYGDWEKDGRCIDF